MFVEQFDAALRGAVKVHTVRPVKLRGQRFDLLFDRRFQRIQKADGFAFVLLDAAQHGFSQTGRAGAALVKMSGHDGFDVQSSAELDRLAHTDTLTGLHNRRYLDQELERHIEVYKRYRHPFALLMLDFDNLKWVNDTFGHAAGDSALKHLAALMRMNVRDVDIPCRFGGDEFVILMPETEKSAIQQVGYRIAESVSKTRFKIGRSFASLQVSFGTSFCPGDGVESEALLQEADASRYRAKEQKTDRVSKQG